MSRAGRANEVGSVFRCGVATYVVVHGMRGLPVAGLDVPSGVNPIRVDFETTDPTDDLRVSFSDGRCAFISAKRKVQRGAPLRDTLRQWMDQVQELGDDDLLVLAGEEFVGPLRGLGDALQRRRQGRLDEVATDRKALEAVATLVPDALREKVLDHARVLHLPQLTSGGQARSLLISMMDFVVDEQHGRQAVAALSDALHGQAGQGSGSGVDNWVHLLEEVGLTVHRDIQGPAAMRVAARRAAVSAYRETLLAQAGHLDLSLLAEDLSPIVREKLVDSLRIRVDGERTDVSLIRHLRRWRRMLIIGQPGAGKSIALREIAAHCAAHPDGPIPVVIPLPKLLALHPGPLSVDLLIEVGVRHRVGEEHQQALVGAIEEALSCGEVLLLLDGLDECGHLASWVVTELVRIQTGLRPRTGLVMCTRASTQRAALRLGLPRVELTTPADLNQSVDEILVSCAAQRVAAEARSRWLEVRRAWMSEARDRHESLLNIPLLAALVALTCAETTDFDLPQGRAAVLHTAVVRSVKRWERIRQASENDRPWSADVSQAMLLRGFIELGRLLDGGSIPSRTDALLGLQRMLRDPERWALSPASAEEVADDVLRFWDEHVAVFVINPAGELTSRSKVFTDIATAMWTTDCSAPALGEWLAGTVKFTDSDDAIGLAAGLSLRLIDTLLDIGSAPTVEATVLVGELAVGDVVELSNQQTDTWLTQVRDRVRESAAGERMPLRQPKNPPLWMTRSSTEASRDAWPYVELACRLPIPASLRQRRGDVLAAIELSPAQEVVATALRLLTDAHSDNRRLDDPDVGVVVKALNLPLPSPEEPIRHSRHKIEIVSGEPLTPGLSQVALGAAERIGEFPPQIHQRIMKIARLSSLSEGAAILQHVRDADVETSPLLDTTVFSSFLRWAESHDDHISTFLADIASFAEAPAELSDTWSLSAIGDLVAVTRYASTSAPSFDAAFENDTTSLRREWLRALARARGISLGTAASQAVHVLGHPHNGVGDTPRFMEWRVVSVPPSPGIMEADQLETSLSPEDQRGLLASLEAASDWMAWSAAAVMVNVQDPVWDCANLFSRDLRVMTMRRAALVYLVALSTAGDACDAMLDEAVESDSADHRLAARWFLDIDTDLGCPEPHRRNLQHDPDLAVRPADARYDEPVVLYWSCDYCRAHNPVDEDDCPQCDRGHRPSRP